MLALIIRRLALGLVTVWLVSVIIFLGVEALPGDACTAILERDAHGEALEKCREIMGLTTPAFARYMEWSAGLLTGDLGAMAVDGQITYLGRADDMMNAGGYRVSPLEVEAALAGFPGIDAIGVIDVMAKQDVRVIAAFYTGAKVLDEDALQRYAQTKLARYKQPRIFVHLPNLPTGPNGKLLRRALRVNFEATDDQT